MIYKTVCCVIVIITNLSEHFSALIEDISVSEREEALNKCISDFLYAFCTAKYGGFSKHCNGDLVTNFNLPTNQFVKIITNNGQNQSFFNDFEAKIFFFDVRATKTTFFNQFKANYHLNRKAPFIFLQEKFSLAFFEEAKEFFIKPIYVIEEDLKIYLVDPFVSGNAQRIDYFAEFFGSCSNLDEGFRKIKARRKIKKWSNTTLSIFYRIVPPWVNEDDHGAEQNILRIATQFLQMKNNSRRLSRLEFKNEKDPSSGRYQSEILSFLQNGDVDAIVGSFFPTLDTIKDFEGSIFYEVDSLNIIGPMPDVMPVWKRVFAIYTSSVLILFLISMTVVLIFIQAFYNHDLMTTFTWFFQITIDSSVLNIQRKANFRFILASYMLFCLVDSTAFKNTLQLIYFSERYEDAINTKDEAIDSGLKFYVFRQGLINHMKNSTVAEEREASNRMEICTDLVSCFSEVAYRNAVIAFLRVPILYAIPKYFIDPETNHPLINIGDPIEMVSMQMIFRKFYPPFDDINWALSMILEGGIYDFEVRRVVWEYLLKASRLDKLKSKVLTLRHLLFVIFIWTAGMIVAFLTFLAELVVFYYS